MDILKVFNNPINEEQAWAVCYQCAHFLSKNPDQEFYQVVFDAGINSIWLSRHGEVFLRKAPSDPNGSGKGPPTTSPGTGHGSQMDSPHTFLPRKKRHVIVTESDAVQALGTVIFQTLDYGLEASEERQLSAGLETLIVTMTNADNSLDLDHEQSNADDEGIEKDADLDTRATVADVIKLCIQHVPSKQDAHHHYKAVCRALATEAGELFTFLDKISSGREQLSENKDEDAKRLEELQRADWACLWVQVMRSLRQGVHLKKVEHVTLPALEYELTPFEVILEDIRSRRYSLQKIMVNGEIPQKVKSDAHAVILNFIRSRPPLKRVDERKLKPKPPSPPDPHERLLTDIRSRPALRPVRQGRLVVQRSQGEPSSPSSCDSGEEELVGPKVKRVIKPDFNLLLNNSFEIKNESSSEDDQSDISQHGSPLSHSSPIYSSRKSWQRAVTRENLISESSRSRQLQRRHTITVCESPTENTKVAQDLPPLEEEDEPSPVRESHFLSPNIQPRHPSLARAASDNDLLANVTLRHHQGVSGRRSSLDHRRSITSIPTGLTAIPELDDSHGGLDSPGKHSSMHLQRWSHEQAPPPNPSPPCKGRVLLERSMSMTSMKASSGSYQPLSRHQSFKNNSYSSRMTSGANSTSSRTSSLLSQQRMSAEPSSPHASLPSSSPRVSTKSYTSSLSSPSTPLSSSQRSHDSSALDRSVSCQSPVFFKKTRALHKQIQDTKLSDSANSENTKSDVKSQSFNESDRISRWRNPRAREERLSKKRSVRESSHSSIAENEEFDNSLPSEPNDSIVFEEKPTTSLSRRLSLDNGVRRYTGRSSGVTVDGEDVTCVKRRLSLGIKERKAIATPRRKAEEEERVKRWRTLQEEDLASRRNPQEELEHSDERVPSVDNRTWLSSSTTKNTNTESSDNVNTKCHVKQIEPQQRGGMKKTISAPIQMQNEDYEYDPLQEKIAIEEKRLARWRRLEEIGVGVEENLNSPNVAPAGQPTTSRVSASEERCVPPSMLPLAAFFKQSQKRWQNPVECLSLTLEEVTHIRSVLTKAELESLLSHPDLYQQVAKNKLCFTCKTTRFSLFGEWGTKCKFCKRTVCSKCLRKMNVPTDHFRNIPVYTLSPAPLSPRMQEFVETYIKSAPASSVPPTRDPSPLRDSSSPVPPAPSSSNIKPKPLLRSQSVVVPGQRLGNLSRAASIKGPVMAICCDCKGMVMEIIRASRASLAMLSAQSAANSTISLPTATSLF